jgi:hypothetical protein
VNRLGAGQAYALAPGHQPLGRPLRVSLVALWQVLGYGGKSPFVSATHVAGHALAPVQHLHHMGCHAQLQHLPNQGVGGAVAVALKLDMTIYMHPYGLKDGPLPGLGGQRHQGRDIDLGKHAGPAAGHLLKGALVQVRQQGGNGLVDFLHAGKALFAKSHQYPALNQLNAQLDLGLVLQLLGVAGRITVPT